VPLSVAGVERASGGGFRVIGSTERSSPELPGESGRLVVRGYNRRGGLDRDVGGSGTVVVPLPGGRPARAVGVARRPDGKLVVVGSVGGMTRVGFPYHQSVAHALLEQPASRLVVAGIGAGSEFSPSSGCALAVARLSAR
jgi:hypothetical protein